MFKVVDSVSDRVREGIWLSDQSLLDAHNTTVFVHKGKSEVGVICDDWLAVLITVLCKLLNGVLNLGHLLLLLSAEFILPVEVR